MKKCSDSVKIAISSISEHLDGKKMSNVVIENQNFASYVYSELSNKSGVENKRAVGTLFQLI